MTDINGLESVYFFDSVSDLNLFIQKQYSSQIIFLCDSNTYQYCFLPYFNSNTYSVITIDPGDYNKNPQQLFFVCEELLKLHADRDALLINLGGGMVCDLGGMTASIFKRGIRFINIPTTTLAMADAALGGKTGINLGLVKNALGTFHHANSVCIATDFIKTLPQREHISGFAEIIKMLLLFDCKEWNKIAQHPAIPAADNPLLSGYIKAALAAKGKIVQQDPLEKGIRKSLNYGHSIGHAIEAVYNEKSDTLLHGEAIFWGIQLENLVANQMGIMSSEWAVNINSTLSQIFPLPTQINKIDKIIESLRNDKKNKDEKIQMTLLKEPGLFVINVEVPLDIVKHTLKHFNNL